MPEREVSRSDLISNLNYQCNLKGVEILCLIDNMAMTVGRKRNLLLNMAQGEHLCFVDDDDSYHSGAVDKLLEAIENNPGKKLYCFWGTQNENGNKSLDFRYDATYSRSMRRYHDGKQIRAKVPDHLCVWKTDIARKEEFPNKNLSEDHIWAENMRKHYTNDEQFIIEDYIYHYEFSNATTLCRRK